MVKLVTGRSLQMGYNDRFSTYETFHCCFVVQIKNMYTQRKSRKLSSVLRYPHYDWYLELSFEWFPLTIQNLVALRCYFKSNLSLAVIKVSYPVPLSNATSIHIYVQMNHCSPPMSSPKDYVPGTTFAVYAMSSDWFSVPSAGGKQQKEWN